MPTQDINRTAESLKAQLNGGKERLGVALNSAMHEVIEMLEKGGYEVKKHSVGARDSVNKYVKVNPFKSLGIAMIAGAAIAFFLRR